MHWGYSALLLFNTLNEWIYYLGAEISFPDSEKRQVALCWELKRIIGYKLIVEHAGNLQKAEMTEQADDKTYHVAYADGNDNQLTYEEVINMPTKESEEGHYLWTLTRLSTPRSKDRW